jgi:undecaprenyl-diphosphatase
MGTLLAVLSYFRADWVRMIKAFFASVAERRIGDDTNRRLVWLILIGTLPAAVVGLLAESRIDEIFHRTENLRFALLVIAVMMVVMALLLLYAERIGSRRLDIGGVRLNSALGVGAAQALSLIPGVSRSGSTITAGLFFGLKRDAAARFSFLLSTPIVIAAGLKKLYDLLQGGGIPADQQLGFLVGFLTSAVSGFLCIHFLLRYLQRRSTAPFIWYRLVVGIGIAALVMLGGA